MCEIISTVDCAQQNVVLELRTPRNPAQLSGTQDGPHSAKWGFHAAQLCAATHIGFALRPMNGPSRTETSQSVTDLKSPKQLCLPKMLLSGRTKCS